jgi:hypothetical protein
MNGSPKRFAIAWLEHGVAIASHRAEKYDTRRWSANQAESHRAPRVLLDMDSKRMRGLARPS